MEEIRIGDYCRTRGGEIGVITKIYPRLKWRKRINPSLLDFNEIKNHSEELIDLIEEGDYVNGEKVVGRGNNCILILTDEGQTFLRNIFEDKDIKSIVTKEAFKSVEYIVEGR